MEETKQEEPKEEKPLSIVEEAAKIRDEIRQEREALVKERKELQTARAENMLAGTAGNHIEPKSPEETFKEKAQAQANEIVGAFKDGE